MLTVMVIVTLILTQLSVTLPLIVLLVTLFVLLRARGFGMAHSSATRLHHLLVVAVIGLGWRR